MGMIYSRTFFLCLTDSLLQGKIHVNALAVCSLVDHTSITIKKKETDTILKKAADKCFGKGGKML